jgi:hypothetical protein
MWDYLPEGALEHDAYAYLESTRSSNGAGIEEVAAPPGIPLPQPDFSPVGSSESGMQA